MKENTPILIANTRWPLPENLIKKVQAERMINSLIEFAQPLTPEESIGYAEVVAYIMPETSQRVLTSDVVKIYLYCVTKMLEKEKEAIPEECRVDDLTEYEMQKLNELKKWIYKNRGGKEKNGKGENKRFERKNGRGAERDNCN